MHKALSFILNTTTIKKKRRKKRENEQREEQKGRKKQGERNHKVGELAMGEVLMQHAQDPGFSPQH